MESEEEEMANTCPEVHVVPAATDCRALHWPEAQRWNWVPPTQFHSPSSVQAVPVAMAELVPEDVPELDEVPGVAAGEATAKVEVAAGTGATEEEDVVTGEAEGLVDPEPAGSVAKTPPEAVSGAEDEVAGGDVAAGAADEEPLEPEPAAWATAVGQVPVGGLGVAVARPNCSSESPGLGRARSVLS